MWFRRKPRPSRFTRQQSLAAKVVRNPDVVETVTDEGGVELALSLKPARWTRLLGQNAEFPVVRRFRLDKLGRYVWDQCAAPVTVEQLIRRFAREHRMNIREAEVSVTAFFATLMKRGLIGVVPPKDAD